MKKRKIAFTVITLILVAIILVVGITACMKSNQSAEEADSSNRVSAEIQSITTPAELLVDPNAGEYVPPETTAAPVGSGIAIPGWGKITLPANQKDVTVNFPNPDENEGRYYLTFKLELKATGEILYTSGLVPPGKTIQQITLSHPLEAGEHEAIIHVQPYKMDETKAPTNNADMETILVVI